MRKLWPPKVKGKKGGGGVKNSGKKTNHRTLPKPIFEHSKNSFYVALLLLEFKDDL
jgi:hypothetical protein